MHQAHFPFLKTIDDFDFSLQTTLRRQLPGSYLGPELVTEGRNLILPGKSGRGKTHLVIAIAYKAIQNGFTAFFTTAAALIEDLSVATARGKLREALVLYLQPHLLVIDEVGYLSVGPDAANVLFHLVNERHLRQRPLLFTTNKSPLTEWGDVLHDHDLAEAIMDRVLERGCLLTIDGPSYRTRHLGLDNAGEHRYDAARVSGTYNKDGSLTKCGYAPAPKNTPEHSADPEMETVSNKASRRSSGAAHTKDLRSRPSDLSKMRS